MGGGSGTKQGHFQITQEDVGDGETPLSRSILSAPVCYHSSSCFLMNDGHFDDMSGNGTILFPPTKGEGDIPEPAKFSRLLYDGRRIYDRDPSSKVRTEGVPAHFVPSPAAMGR